MCEIGWYNEFLGLNPVERERRDLVVAYAEDQGGSTEQYLRAVYARYWQKVEFRDTFERIGDDLNLQPPQQAKILAEMAKVVVPALRASFPEGPTAPRLPETVGHI